MEKELTPSEIRNLRKSLGLSQRQFAKLIGVKRLTIARWEAGNMKPKKEHFEILEKLANDIKVSFNDTKSESVSSKENVSSSNDTNDTKNVSSSENVSSNDTNDTIKNDTNDTIVSPNDTTKNDTNVSSHDTNDTKSENVSSENVSSQDPKG
jgi:transcriptional regulator with XRE-family HTH domain